MTIKAKFLEGLSNVSRVFPVLGKVKGTGMVLKSTSKLKKPTRKLLKGGKKL